MLILNLLYLFDNLIKSCQLVQLPLRLLVIRSCVTILVQSVLRLFKVVVYREFFDLDVLCEIERPLRRSILI